MAPPIAPPKDIEEPTTFPDEDYESVKKDVLALRARATAMVKRKRNITDGTKAGWEKQFPSLFQKRPTLFLMAADPNKDLTMALRMIEIMSSQRKAGNLNRKDANIKVMDALAKIGNVPEAAKWIEKDSV
jgi:hypothetical protein